MSPPRTSVLFSIAALVLSVANSGCSLSHHARCHDPAEALAVVDVGGRVHQPRSIEIGPAGLTLHRALLAAGGARETLVSQADGTVDMENESHLKALVDEGRALGVVQFHNELFQKDVSNGTAFAAVATLRTAAEALAEMRRLEHVMETHKAVLFESLQIETVKSLAEQSPRTGKVQERLRLFDLLPGGLAGVSRQEIQDALDIAIDAERKLLLQLNKATSQTWQRSERGERLVALDRPSSDPPVTYYFPYEFAITGLPGEISLRDGDAVEVIDLQDTELAPMGGYWGALRDIAIQGAVTAPGVVNDISRIGDVHINNPPTIADPRGVWMLVRPAESGLRQKVFVLPNRMVAVNGPAANAPTLEGDVYTYLILPQVPIVLESLVVRTLSGVKARHGDRLGIVERHRQKNAERAQIREAVPNAATVQRTPTPIR